MTFQVAATDLIKVLNPAAASTRAAYSAQRRPWLPGYAARYRAEGAALVYGVNHPGYLDATKVTRFSGAGATATTSPFAYTMPSGAPTLPVTASLTEANDYLDAIMVATSLDGTKTLVPRVAYGGSTLASAFWRVTSTTAIVTASGVSGGNFTDWPAGTMLEIIVPAATDLVKLVDASGAGEAAVLTLKDFLAAGGSGKTSVVELNRVFQ